MVSIVNYETLASWALHFVIFLNSHECFQNYLTFHVLSSLSKVTIFGCVFVARYKKMVRGKMVPEK